MTLLKMSSQLITNIQGSLVWFQIGLKEMNMWQMDGMEIEVASWLLGFRCEKACWILLALKAKPIYDGNKNLVNKPWAGRVTGFKGGTINAFSQKPINFNLVL